MTGFENLEIKIHPKNKWRIDFIENGKLKHTIAIPPTNSDRVDFIDRHCKYCYNYNRPVSHGVLIQIKKGKAKLILIPYGQLKRIKNAL